MATPSRKRAAAEATTPGWAFGLFSSAKKARPAVGSSMKATRNNEARILPRIVLSPPSAQSPTVASTNHNATMGVTALNGESSMASGTINNAVGIDLNGSGTLLSAWKPPASGKASGSGTSTFGNVQFHIGTNSTSHKLKRSRYRPPPYKPQSRTLVRKTRAVGNDNKKGEPFDKDAMERLMQQNKNLFPRSTVQDDPLAFKPKIVVKRRLGTNQTGSRLPPLPPTQVSHSEQQQEDQNQQRQVSFQVAQTPASKSTPKPRLQRLQTPGFREQPASSSVSFATPAETPLRTSRGMQRQQTPGMGLSQQSGSNNSSRSPSSHGASSPGSTIFSPREEQDHVARLESLDGPFVFDGPAVPNRTSAQSSSAIVPPMFMHPDADGEMLRPPRRGFTRVALLVEKEPEVLFTVDDENGDQAVENSPKKTKTAASPRAGDKAPLTDAGWGAQMFPDKGSWKCTACLTSNPLEAGCCKACETPKDGNTSDAGTTAKTSAPPAVSGGSSFSFGVAPAGVSFGVSTAAAGAPTVSTPAPAAGGFSFGAATSPAPAAASISFGAAPAAKAGFSFGVTKSDDDAKPAATKTPSKISFGTNTVTAPSTEPPPANKKSSITAAAPKTEVKAPAGGAKFNFGAAVAAAPTGASGAFSFGSGPPAGAATSSTPLSATAKPFEAASATKQPRISFGAGPANDDDGSRKKKRRGRDDDDSPAAPPVTFPIKTDAAPAAPAFSFGSKAAPAPASAAPVPAFSFGAKSAAPAPTDGPAPAFSFGSKTPAAATPGPTNDKPGFAFGSTSTTNPFSTGTPGPSTSGGSLTFGSSTTPAPAASTAAPTPGGASFKFGANAAPATTPGTSFGAAPSFGATPAAVAPSSFGATPAFGAAAAPAATPNASFGGTGFGNGPPAAANSFGATPAAGNSFTFGGAPAPQAAAGGFGGTPAPQGAISGFGGTPAPQAAIGGFGGTPAPQAAIGGFGGTPAPQAAVGGFGGTPAPQAAVGGFGATPGGGFAATPVAPPANSFGTGGGFGGPPANQFGGGGMSTPAGPGFSMGSSKAKTTGRRRIIKAKRPPGSAHR